MKSCLNYAVHIHTYICREWQKDIYTDIEMVNKEIWSTTYESDYVHIHVSK